MLKPRQFPWFQSHGRMTKGIYMVLGALGETRQPFHQRRGAVVEAHLASLQQWLDDMGAGHLAATGEYWQ